MHTVLIVIHLMIVFSLIAVVLLQRSEGGALGIGGGGGFLTSRGQANVLTRATAFLAAGFFATSLALSILAGWGRGGPSVFDRPSPTQPAAPTGPTAPLGGGQGGILNQLRPGGAPPAPTAAPPAPAAPAEPAPPISAPSGQTAPPPAAQ